jgi:hypothetical protein
MSQTTARQYDPTDIDVMLASETDPWLQRPDGSEVDLEPHLAPLAVGDCGECRGGFFAPTDNGPTGQGIELCDACNKFPGDLDAAVALAALIGPDVSVWYLPQGQDDDESVV